MTLRIHSSFHIQPTWIFHDPDDRTNKSEARGLDTGLASFALSSSCSELLCRSHSLGKCSTYPSVSIYPSPHPPTLWLLFAFIQGFYAGYVASAFIFGRFLSGYVWGYFTDSIGRKPVIVATLLSVATFSLAFGFSTSYTWALSSRCTNASLW